MRLDITFRHMNAREEVKNRAESLFEKLHRFLDASAEAHLTIGSEAGKAEVELVVTSRGEVSKAIEADDDLRTALDRAFHRVEDQLRRDKEKAVSRRRRKGSGDEDDVSEEVPLN
jgi:ribosomal subunit interface protein